MRKAKHPTPFKRITRLCGNSSKFADGVKLTTVKIIQSKFAYTLNKVNSETFTAPGNVVFENVR